LTDAYAYQGNELDVFAHAINWKRYFAKKLIPYIRGDVLEVGAGIGTTTRVLSSSNVSTWACLEPDPLLASRLKQVAREKPFQVEVDIEVGTLDTFQAIRQYDTVLYIDVLEHIEDDRGELSKAAELVKQGGKLIVLCPAHQYLFSPFDHAIGHFRRYTKRRYREICPTSVHEVSIFYLDSLGLFLSLANKLLLKSSSPSVKQIKFWDRLVVRLTKLVDPCLAYRFGKTVVAVWEKR
jgi:SAM-dependent methyltransferase